MIEFIHTLGNILAKTHLEDGTVVAVHANPSQPEYALLLNIKHQMEELREDRDQFAMALDIENTSTEGLLRCYQQVISDLDSCLRINKEGKAEKTYYQEVQTLLGRQFSIEQTGRAQKNVKITESPFTTPVPKTKIDGGSYGRD